MTAKDLKVGDLVTNGIFTGIVGVFNSSYCIIKHRSGLAKCKIKDVKPVKKEIELL